MSMDKKLIIAEKPSLGMKIVAGIGQMKRADGYFENEKFIVTFAFGHLFGLKSIEQYLNCEKGRWSLEQLPFFPEKFEYILKDDDGVRKQYKIIKKLYQRQDVKSIVNAGDPDREGSVIILNILRELENETGIHKPVERIWLTATTPEFVREAMNNLKPEEAYGNLYEEGLTRTYADWLWGINFTRFVTLKAGEFYPVGRVLNPIVKFIFDRDRSIENFQKETYYEIDAEITRDGTKVKSKIKGLRFSAEQKEEGEAFVYDLFTKLEITSELKAVVTKVETKDVVKAPPKLFSLDKLQNKMSKDFKYSSAETLAATQSLYEKCYVTYPRTNTEYLATAEKSSVNEILGKLSKEEGIPLVLKESKSIFDDSKIEGHTALIITGKNPVGLSEKEENVYQTIKNRFICNFLDEKTVLQETLVEIGIKDDSGDLYVIELKGTAVLQEGFLKYEPIKSEKFLPRFTEGEILEGLELQLSEKTTKPPSHVSEAELNGFLKNPFRRTEIDAAMEEADEDAGMDEEDYKAMLQGCEIGTVATRAGIIENAQRYEYVKKEKNLFHITEKGTAFIYVLEQLGIHLDKTKTVEMGMDLKKVYRKEMTLEEVVGKTRRDIADIVDKGKNTVIENSYVSNSAGNKVGNCPLCGGSILPGKKNYYCSNYREKGFRFVIWKTIAQKELSPNQVTQLLEKRKTSLIKGFTKKAGGTFNAYLVLSDAGEVKFEFPKKSRSKMSKESKKENEES